MLTKPDRAIAFPFSFFFYAGSYNPILDDDLAYPADQGLPHVVDGCYLRLNKIKNPRN